MFQNGENVNCVKINLTEETFIKHMKSVHHISPTAGGQKSSTSDKEKNQPTIEMTFQRKLRSMKDSTVPRTNISIEKDS